MSIDVNSSMKQGQVSSNIYIKLRFMPGMQGWFAFENPLLWVTTLREQTRETYDPPQMQKMQFTVGQPRLPTYLTQQHLPKAANIPHTAAFAKSYSQSRWRHSTKPEQSRTSPLKDACKGQQLNRTRWGQSEHCPRAERARQGWPLSLRFHNTAPPQPATRGVYRRSERGRSQSVLIHRWQWLFTEQVLGIDKPL